MDKLKRLPVGGQIILNFGLICAVLVVIGVFLFFRLRTIERQNETLQTQILNEWTLSNDLSRNLRLEQIEIFRHVQTNDSEEIKREDQIISSMKEADASRWSDYGKLVDNEAETRLYTAAMQARTLYWEKTESMLTLSRVNRDAEAREIAFSTQEPAYEEYQKTINDIADWTAREGGEMATESTRLIIQTRRIGDTLIGLAMLITVGTGVALVGVTRRLKEDNIVLQTEIEERKQAEETLRESEEKFRQLADNISDVFWITSPDLQKTIYVSPAFELIWGRSADSVYAHPLEWTEAILPEERERVFTLFSTLGTGAPSVSVEFQITRPDGEMRWIHSRGFPIRDASGKVIRLAGIAADITERKSAEKQMERLRNEHMTILNSVSEGMHWVDAEGQIRFENPAAARMLGYEISELVGRPAHLTMHHSHANGAPYPVTECPIYATIKDEVTRRVKDEVFWRKDGTSFPVEYTTTPVRDENGRPDGVVVVFTDMSERKLLEARMFQSQKMETVGKLAGGVAHEFNSILTAIIGQTELLLSDLPSGDPLGQNAREIRQAADRAATLTRQLLAYGRKQILQPEILDLNHVLANIVGTLEHLLGREVDVRIVPAIGLKTVKIDPGQMEQVIVNIAMNAADAMPNGGKLTFETANVTLDEEYVRSIPGLKPGGYVMLAITDTGIGMSEEVKARAFEPFFSTKGVGQGTGLGLATCYGILKQSEGHINVYSEVARGATFRIYLPQVESPVKLPLPRLKSPDLPRGTETILLAEDDPSLLEMSATLLRRLGYTVLTAANGVEALNLKNQRNIGRIDLLFTDIVMPHMSGKELSDRIWAIYPHTKILFTSAYTENAVVHQGILNEGVTLLQKPYTPSALANKVREVLDRPLSSLE